MCPQRGGGPGWDFVGGGSPLCHIPLPLEFDDPVAHLQTYHIVNIVMKLL